MFLRLHASALSPASSARLSSVRPHDLGTSEQALTKDFESACREVWTRRESFMVRRKIVTIYIVAGLVACVLYLVRDWDLRQTLLVQDPEPVQRGPLGDRLTDKIDVFGEGWYGEGKTVGRRIEVRESAGGDGRNHGRPKSVLGECRRETHLPAGDPKWDAWDPPWYRDCIRKVERGEISIDQGGFDYCSSLANAFQPPGPDREERLFGAVSRVVGVTRQRVYVEVRPEFLTMLVIGEDFGRFPADTGRDHKDPLMALLSSEGESPKSYTFRSWREKRRRASLQCVVAIPGSEDGKYFADIDIDLTNPLSDPWAFLGHLIDEPTDHLRL